MTARRAWAAAIPAVALGACGSDHAAAPPPAPPAPVIARDAAPGDAGRVDAAWPSLPAELSATVTTDGVETPLHWGVAYIYAPDGSLTIDLYSHPTDCAMCRAG